MKIALINENSQAAKNGVIVETLKKVVEPLGHEVLALLVTHSLVYFAVTL